MMTSIYSQWRLRRDFFLVIRIVSGRRLRGLFWIYNVVWTTQESPTIMIPLILFHLEHKVVAIGLQEYNYETDPFLQTNKHKDYVYLPEERTGWSTYIYDSRRYSSDFGQDRSSTSDIAQRARSNRYRNTWVSTRLTSSAFVLKSMVKDSK